MTTTTQRPHSDGHSVKHMPRSKLRVWIIGILCLIMLCFVMLASIMFGSAAMTVSEIWGTLSHKLGFMISPDFPAPSQLRQSILLELRIPRILMAAAVGAALAVAGVALQSVTHNDLAEPYLLGVSAGASTGAVTVLLFLSSSAIGLSGGAVVGALCSFGLLLFLLRGSGFASTRVVLTGVLVGQLFSAFTSLLLVARGDAENVRGVMFWLLGTLGSSRWDSFVIVAIVSIIAIVVLWSMARYFDALSFGDDTANSMGVPVNIVRAIALITVALLTAATVSAVGAIGFVGLIVPHAARLLVGPNHARLIPIAAIIGSNLLVITDAAARSVFSPQEIPVGVFTALIGVPIFFFLLKRGRRL